MNEAVLAKLLGLLALILIFIVGIVVDAKTATFVNVGVWAQIQTTTIASCVPSGIDGMTPIGLVFNLPEAKKDVRSFSYPDVILRRQSWDRIYLNVNFYRHAASKDQGIFGKHVLRLIGGRKWEPTSDANNSHAEADSVNAGRRCSGIGYHKSRDNVFTTPYIIRQPHVLDSDSRSMGSDMILCREHILLAHDFALSPVNPSLKGKNTDRQPRENRIWVWGIIAFGIPVSLYECLCWFGRRSKPRRSL